jgi:hypothetical protein
MLHTFIAVIQDRAGVLTRVASSLALGLVGTIATAQTAPIHIQILNATNGHPIKNRSPAMILGTNPNTPEGLTDSKGQIVVTADPKTTIRLVTQPYAECRPKLPDPWEIKYSVEDILATGLSTPNVCGKAHATAKPGEIIIFERPRGLLNLLAAPIAY